MATTYRIVSQCAGGEHLQVEVTDGKSVEIVPMLLSDVMEVKASDHLADVRKLMAGKTQEQVVSELCAGVCEAAR